MPGEWYPFYLVDRVTLDANGEGTSALTIGATEEFEGERIFFIVSTGTFNITDMKDSSGLAYTDAQTSDPLGSAVFLTALDQRTNVSKFTTPLQLVPNTEFNITFANGTNAATIDVIIIGKKRSI